MMRIAWWGLQPCQQADIGAKSVMSGEGCRVFELGTRLVAGRITSRVEVRSGSRLRLLLVAIQLQARVAGLRRSAQLLRRACQLRKQ